MVSGPSPLHGRHTELDRIDDLLDHARASRSAVLVLHGPAGIGKTTLLDAARRRAAGLRVLACRGTHSEAQLPFAALHQLLRPLLGRVDALPPIQAGALRAALGLEAQRCPAPFLVALAVLGLLAEEAARGPVLCLVDDAHRLDDATAGILHFIARRLDGEPIALLFARRDAVDTLPQLALEGLDADAARALLHDCGDGPLAPEPEDWLVRVSSGNPLALLELSGGLTDGQRAGVEPIFGPVAISAPLERAFLERVERLPAATRRLLLVAATDESGDLTTILDAAGRLDVPATALDDAERARLVRVDGLRLQFRHPLVRSAIYQGARLSQRRAAHGALAAVLIGEARADRRAWHRAAASVEPDPAVVDELEQAAHRARAHAGYDAASLALERAAALAPDERRRAGLIVEAAENAWLPGQCSRARALLRRARSLAADATVRADADRLFGLVELTCGIPGESTQLLSAAAAAVEREDPERALYLLSLGGWGAAYVRDGEAIARLAERAERLPVAETPVNRFLLARLAGLRAHFGGDDAAAARQFRAALALVDQLEDGALPHCLGLVSLVGLFLCDDRAVLALHRRVAAHAREAGMVTVLAQSVPWVALGDIWGGHWRSAAAVLAEGLGLARGVGQHQIAAHLVAIQALLAAHHGDEARCRALAKDALEQASARRLVHVACCAAWALEILELGLGRPEAALAHARALPVVAGVDWDALDRIEAAARAGETRLAAAWLAAFERWAESGGARWGEAVALHCRALLAAKPDEAERLFVAALEAHDRAGRPFEYGRTELAFGEFLRRARRRADARRYLRAALQRFEALGAAQWAQRARTELRATGQTARKRDPSTLDELTVQEVQVAQLVAEGRTNRDVAGVLFLSPRTIDFHLRNVFRKLGITSRNELARIDLAQAAGRA